MDFCVHSFICNIQNQFFVRFFPSCVNGRVFSFCLLLNSVPQKYFYGQLQICTHLFKSSKVFYNLLIYSLIYRHLFFPFLFVIANTATVDIEYMQRYVHFKSYQPLSNHPLNEVHQFIHPAVAYEGTHCLPFLPKLNTAIVITNLQ